MTATAKRYAGRRQRGATVPSAIAAPTENAASPDGNENDAGWSMSMTGASTIAENGRGRRKTNFKSSATSQASTIPRYTVSSAKRPRLLKPRAREMSAPASHQIRPFQLIHAIVTTSTAMTVELAVAETIAL